MPLIYIAKHRVTGKVYIGCTERTLPQRKFEHAAAAQNGSPLKFHKALRELGFDSFLWEVLENTPPGDAMYARERYWVARYNSFKTGLNSTPGGRGSENDGAKHRRKLPVTTFGGRYRPKVNKWR
jgi:hypothetical protein